MIDAWVDSVYTVNTIRAGFIRRWITLRHDKESHMRGCHQGATYIYLSW